MNALSQFADPAFCITRLSVGLMFACHGGQKILGFPQRGHGMPTETLGIIGAWIELATGFMIALGFLARIAAFIASGEMAVGYFIAHAPGGFFSVLKSWRASGVLLLVLLLSRVSWPRALECRRIAFQEETGCNTGRRFD